MKRWHTDAKKGTIAIQAIFMHMERKILVVEPNPHHYVVIPGFVRYIYDLGYIVDCLVRKHESLGNEFCLCANLQSKINYIYYDDLLSEIRDLQSEITYDFVFVTSFDYYVNGKIESIFVQLKEVDKSRYGIVGCYHALSSYMVNKSVENLSISRIVSLSQAEGEAGKFTTVTPCFFAEGNIMHQKTMQTEIVCVGVNNDPNESRFALNKLYSDYGKIPHITYIGGKRGRELKRTQLKKKILFPVIKMLKIKKYMNERYAPFPRIRKDVEDNISVEGILSFEDMFDAIQNADFILINTANRLSDEFGKYATSGSKLLSLGFCKPCIIERKYAEHYGLSDNNSVIYESGELEVGLKRALLMTQTEYKSMFSEMKKLQEDIYKDSLRGFGCVLNKLMHESNERENNIGD